MPQPKFRLYKYIKLADGSWRYCKLPFIRTEKSSPAAALSAAKKKKYPEGSYYLYQNKSWIPVGADALDAQLRRNAQLDKYDTWNHFGAKPNNHSNLRQDPTSDGMPTVFFVCQREFRVVR